MREYGVDPADDELVRRARKGDVLAFEQLIRRYFDMVYSVAYVRLQRRDAAEDLAQEVFLRAFLHLDTVREPSRFAAWLGQVTRRLAYRWQQDRRRHSSLIAIVPLESLAADVADTRVEKASETMENRETVRAVRDAIFQLPAEQAEILLLRFGEGLNPPEIARRLDLHATTVRRRIDKALASMKKSIAPILTDVAPSLLPPREAAIRTVRMVDAVAVLSPVEAAALGKLSAGVSEKGVWATAMPLRSWYYWAYRTTPGRIVMPRDVAEKRYDITMQTSREQFEELYPAMQKLLAVESGLEARWEKREMDVYTLTAPDERPRGLRPPAALPKGVRSIMKLDSTRGSECRSSELVCLVIHLEENVDRPVIDETNLLGRYDWEATWPRGAKAKAIIHAVREQLGLQMLTARRTVEMLVLKEGRA
ncbi:MAG TPA: TIGR03435 family protein [Planctomycetota bacterium]|nr:TIGR03435 family protein [Planctomycetota bacterium]